MSSTKTTLLGILTIAAALTGAAKTFVASGTCDWATTIAAVSAGIGLIKARDHSVSDANAGAK